MENQPQPQPQPQPQAPSISMAARPWFRLTSIRASEVPVATPAPAPPPVAAPPPRPPPPAAPERPLLRLGSLLDRTLPATVPPRPQEPPAQAPSPPQTRPPTPPTTAPTTVQQRPPSPPTPLMTTAATRDQQPPSPALRSPVLAPSPAVRAPSPPAPPSPVTTPTAIRLSEPTPIQSVAVRQQQQPPPPYPSRITSVSPPPPPPSPVRTLFTAPAPSPRLPSPPVRTLSPASAPSPRLPTTPVTILTPAPAPSPRIPSPSLYPEPETKPVVTVVTAQPAWMPEPTSAGSYNDRNNNINGNGGKRRLGMTQGDQLKVVAPPPPPPTTSHKKPDPAAVPGKKKSGATDEAADSRMRVLTLAGENMGAYMNLGSGVHRGGTKGHGRHLTQAQTAAPSVEKAALAVAAPGSNGIGDASAEEEKHIDSDAKDVKTSTGASKWKAGAASAKPMAALVNSNVQSVNNSIMFNSCCTQQSPGVHITLSRGSRRPNGNGNQNGYGGRGEDNARANDQ